MSVDQVPETNEGLSEQRPDGGGLVPEVVTPQTWQSRSWDWLEHAGKRVGVPVLVLSALSLCIAIASLCIGLANYRFNLASDRPNLNSADFYAVLEAPAALIAIDWTNVGKKTGRRGTATLFAINKDGDVPSKIGSDRIVGAGTNLFTGSNAAARFRMPGAALPRFFLACTAYFDERGERYEQAFEFERGATSSAAPPNPTVVQYDEMAPPDQRQCSGAW